MSVTYRVEIVGTRLLDRITSEEEWLNYLGTTWNALGAAAVANIQDEISMRQWIRGSGRTIKAAVSWEAQGWSMIVYIDPRVAPYAIHQEEGVHEHIMRYLLTASRPIPVPTGPHFRWATERWMGVPHPYVDETGTIQQATGWTHPGYPGKYFFRAGIQRTLAEATQRFHGLVFRMAEEA